jgi:hypothetical protein
MDLLTLSSPPFGAAGAPSRPRLPRVVTKKRRRSQLARASAVRQQQRRSQREVRRRRRQAIVTLVVVVIAVASLVIWIVLDTRGSKDSGASRSGTGAGSSSAAHYAGVSSPRASSSEGVR